MQIKLAMGSAQTVHLVDNTFAATCDTRVQFLGTPSKSSFQDENQIARSGMVSTK